MKNVMEIGFNSGFSTLLMLISNPNIHISCFDLGEHKYIMPCFNKMKETFGDRINITIGDSTKTLQNINDNYDIIHIDGGHSTEVANSDIINSYRLSKQGTILIMDDYDFPNLHNIWDSYIVKYNLKKLNINVYNSPHHDIKYVCAINIPKILFQTNNPRANNIYFSIPIFINNVENKTYTWVDSYIKFLNNFKMDAFGEGNYKIIDEQHIIASFGGRIHYISFNIDYTEFSSTRKDDLQIVNGKLIN
jgi:hypothetical protein